MRLPSDACVYAHEQCVVTGVIWALGICDDCCCLSLSVVYLTNLAPLKTERTAHFPEVNLPRNFCGSYRNDIPATTATHGCLQRTHATHPVEVAGDCLLLPRVRVRMALDEGGV